MAQLPDQVRIEEIYQELGQSTVQLPPDQQGPLLLLEKLRECRRKQDHVISTSLEVLRALAQVRKAWRTAKTTLPLMKGTAQYQSLRDQILELEDRLDDMKALEQSVRLVRANLKSTDQGIRLGANLVDQQIKLGGIVPPPAEPVPDPSPHAVTVEEEEIAALFTPPPAGATPPPWEPDVPVPATGAEACIAGAVAPEAPVPPAGRPSVLQQPTITVDPIDIATFFS